MVLSTGDAARSTYLLWRRFKFQTEGGIRDAIAVPEKAGTQLVSAYGFMLQIIYMHIWVAAILAGVYLTVHKRQNQLTVTEPVPDHQILQLSADVWAGRSSPSDVLMIVGTHSVWKSKRWLIALAWLFAALVGLVVNYAIPIVIIPSLVIGSGAPVRPGAIYVPSISNRTTPYQIQIANLENPSALRAAGSILAVDPETADFNISPPVTLETLEDGSPVLQINYSYNITSRDFGMQHYRDLTFRTEGSCYTEYNWWAGQEIVAGTPVDYYYLWNQSNNTQHVSLYDGAVPLVYFFPGTNVGSSDATNITYAALISSIGLKSIFPGKDPWYLTNTTSDDNGYFPVLEARPVLSCWQKDSWTSQGKSVNLSKTSTLPGLSKFPSQLNTVFVRFLVPPKVVTVATRLGTRALESSTSSLGEFFNANTSSLFDDFSRLITTAYITSVNTLTETTLFSRNFSNVPNELSDEDLNAVADFVVFGTNITTLAVLDVIVIPVVALGGRRRGRLRMLERFKAKAEALAAEEEQRSEESQGLYKDVAEVPECVEAQPKRTG
ncbi:MAG: hypothetical protein M1839_006240 [Geoglossum umbratile]|nr:MAG: hypothetical protein M1839_006240 [Geoglossum umbratile]